MVRVRVRRYHLTCTSSSVRVRDRVRRSHLVFSFFRPRSAICTSSLARDKARVRVCSSHVVSPFSQAAEREAMINAAAIAGLNVLSLMHENTAFAFKYGFDKEIEFSKNDTNVVFYDLGAASYKVFS